MRLEELEKNHSDDELYKKREDDELAQKIAFDDLRRQVKLLALEKDALQAELEESRALVEDKEQSLQRIYKKLSEKQDPQVKQERDHNVQMADTETLVYQASENHRQIEFDKLLETIERKTTEIIDLKGRLQQSEAELAGLKRAQMNNAGALMQSNDQNISAMSMSADLASKQMQSFNDLQKKYMDVHRKRSSLEAEKLSWDHQMSDL